MHMKLLALFVAQAAAVAVPSDSGSYIDYEHGIEWPNGLPARSLHGRTVCNADNCLRNLRDARYSSSASDFCSTWLQSTVVNTKYAIATVYGTVTQTPNPLVVTNIVSQDQTVVTATTVVTQYTTRPDPRYNKRDANIGYPPWLSASYPPARVSSACSCFIATPLPAIQQTITQTTATDSVVATNTLPAVTNTVTQTAIHTIGAIATQIVDGGGVTCGIKGCIRGGPEILSTFACNSIAQCKSSCMANPNCKAFDFSTVYNTCLLANVDASSWWTSPACLYKVYDRNCQV